MMGIDMALLDEAPGLLRAAAGVVLVDQATLVVHEAVKVAACACQALTEVVGGHLQNVAANRIARAEDFTEREDQPLLAVQTEQHAHRAADSWPPQRGAARPRARCSDRASRDRACGRWRRRSRRTSSSCVSALRRFMLRT